MVAVGVLVVVAGLGCQQALVESGSMHTCLTIADGTVRCFGYGADGALGSGSTEDRGRTPLSLAGAMAQSVPLLASNRDPSVHQLSASQFNCVVIGSTSEVLCWGKNDAGQLGAGDTLNRGSGPGEMAALQPLPLPPACSPVTQIAVCWAHACILCGDNTTVYCFGANDEGQLGVGDTRNRGTTADWSVGWTPTDLGGVQVAKLLRGVAASHTCAITPAGGMKCWGSNTGSECGYGAQSLGIGAKPGEMGTSLPLIDLKGRKVRDGCLGWRRTCVVYTTNE
eukprot:Hpha_TRINITY_DN20634_c0_g1::TRINITY_DN20634_c0_g1_i1::g.148069::m.148069